MPLFGKFLGYKTLWKTDFTKRSSSAWNIPKMFRLAIMKGTYIPLQKDLFYGLKSNL